MGNDYLEESGDGDITPLPAGDAGGNSLYRAVRTYVLRAGRMTAAQERNYRELSPVWCIPFSSTKLNFMDIFGNTNQTVIEIGFGMGTATAEIAAANPDINFIGIEVHRPGVGRLLGEIQRRELKNLFIIEHDALDVLEQMVVDGSVNGFNIFFPDPWQKKRHNKRRLIRRPHTDLFAQKLASGGYIYMVTDWLPYAHYALLELSATPALKNKYADFAPRQKWRPETKFERRGINEEREINELYFTKENADADC